MNLTAVKKNSSTKTHNVHYLTATKIICIPTKVNLRQKKNVTKSYPTLALY